MNKGITASGAFITAMTDDSNFPKNCLGSVASWPPPPPPPPRGGVPPKNKRS